jgi:hypothetical protein
MKRLITFTVLIAFLSAVGVSSMGCGDEKKKTETKTTTTKETKESKETNPPPK